MFTIQSADLSHTFGCDLEQNQTGVIMKGKGPLHPQYFHDIIRIHSLMIYSDTKTSFTSLYSFHFLSCEKGDIISTGQNMNYQYFTNLKIEKLLQNFFHCIKIE